MDAGQTQLQDRMLRDAIVEVLRGSFDAFDNGAVVSVVDAGLLGQVTVEGDRVRVELALPPKWSPFADALTQEVQRRVQALPEVALTEITVVPGQPNTKKKNSRTAPSFCRYTTHIVPGFGGKERAMPSENEIAVEKFWGPFWSEGDKSLAEEIFDPDFRDLDPQWPNGADGGIPAMKEKHTFYFSVCPDWNFIVLKQLVVDDHVVCHWRGTGTHKGDFAGVPPTDKSMSVEGISMFTCRNGKIVEQVISYDVLGMLQQIGATALPG